MCKLTVSYRLVYGKNYHLRLLYGEHVKGDLVANAQPYTVFGFYKPVNIFDGTFYGIQLSGVKT